MNIKVWDRHRHHFDPREKKTVFLKHTTSSAFNNIVHDSMSSVVFSINWYGIFFLSWIRLYANRRARYSFWEVLPACKWNECIQYLWKMYVIYDVSANYVLKWIDVLAASKTIILIVSALFSFSTLILSRFLRFNLIRSRSNIRRFRSASNLNIVHVHL